MEGNNEVEPTTPEIEVVIDENGHGAQISTSIADYRMNLMHFIKAARKANGEHALAQYQRLLPQVKKIKSIQVEMLKSAQHSLGDAIDSNRKDSKKMVMVIAVLIGIGGVVCILVTWLLTFLLVKPLQHLRKNMDLLAQGNLVIKPNHFLNSKDKIGVALADLDKSAEKLRGLFNSMRTKALTLHDNSANIHSVASGISDTFEHRTK